MIQIGLIAMSIGLAALVAWGVAHARSLRNRKGCWGKPEWR